MVHKVPQGRHKVPQGRHKVPGDYFGRQKCLSYIRCKGVVDEKRALQFLQVTEKGYH